MRRSLWIVAFFAAAVSALAAQNIQIMAVTNSADFQAGLPQGGSLASLFCTGLEGSPGVVSSAPYAGVSVWVNSLPAPILAIAFEDGYQQINIQAPWSNPAGPAVVEVMQNGLEGSFSDANAWSGMPGSAPSAFPWTVFFTDSNHHAVLQHASDYSLVTPQNPAHAGEFLVAYGINLGPVENTPADGEPGPFDPLARAQAPPSICRMEDSVVIGNRETQAAYVGLAPGEIGVYQVNFQVPLGIAPGEQSLVFSRDFLMNPSGECLANGMGSQWTDYTSRPVLIPVGF